MKKAESNCGFCDRTPHYQLSVIQLNSTFAEVTDRDYPVRGIITTLSLVFILGLAWYLVKIGMITTNRWDVSTETTIKDLWFMTFALTLCLTLSSILVFLLLRESFCFTHFPNRFNRKNRKIYVWRRNGTVLSESWDDVVFCLRSYEFSGTKMWDILGHVLDADRTTVKETFAFSSYRSSDVSQVRMHWEYFRRYMEEGPEQPHRMLEVCLPIATRRETWWEGCMRLSLNLHGSLFMQATSFIPFDLPASIGRMFAMRTSKIPQWPEWVEKECAVAENDPFVRESGYIAPPRSEAKAA
ncbi:DUF6708 domain-containing protein [Massilia sp. SR12]